jgi:hypothetical protein
VSFDCEFEQVVHRSLEEKGLLSNVPFVFYLGNESPNIGFPLLDCCLVASS